LAIARIEAMSTECAVDSTNSGGIKEVIRDKLDVLTCAVEEWKKLPDPCQILIVDPEKLQDYKKATQDYCITNSNY
jgi:hypothetical protein